MIVQGTFVKNEGVIDGHGAALQNGELVWAGPIETCPLDQFFEGLLIHVHPALYERILANVAKIEEGIPYDQSSETP